MSNYLLFAQSVFYTVASAAIVVLAVSIVLVVFHLRRVALHLRRIVENAEMLSTDVSEKIHVLLESLETLPILSFLFSKGKGEKKYAYRGKGRE